MDKVKCFECGAMIESAEANLMAFGTIINKRFLCKSCRKAIRDDRRAELRRRKMAEYEERISCEKEQVGFAPGDLDLPKKKYKISNAENLVKAQNKHAEMLEKKELEDFLGL